MVKKIDEIDFTQEPYKSMVNPDDVEYSKQAIRAMVIILGEPDEKGIFRISKEEVCASISGVVVAANYNCPGQLVISGTVPAVEEACLKLTEAGAHAICLFQNSDKMILAKKMAF